MTNEVSINGVLKGLDIGATHSSTFTKVSTESTQSGREVRQVAIETVVVSDKLSYTLKEGQFLGLYKVIDVYCYQINGGKKQYVRLPKPFVYEPLDHVSLKALSESQFHMDEKSWSNVARRYNDIKLDNITEAMRGMTPQNITFDGPFYGTYKITTTADARSGMPAGWGLSAFYKSEGERRDVISTYVSVHRDTRNSCDWKLKEGDKPDTYTIETTPNVHTQHPPGWKLCAHHLGEARNSESTKMCAIEAGGFAMNWKIVPGKADGTWRIITTDSVICGQEKGWGLSAWGPKIGDTVRDGWSSWVHVHKGDYWPMDWVLEKQEL